MKDFFRKLLLCFLCLTLISCGDACEEEVPPTPAEQDAEVQSYIRDFERRYDVEVDYEVRLVDGTLTDRLEVVGMCNWGWGKPTLVRLERSFWLSNNQDRRRALVFHELGHCTFKLGHNDHMFPVQIRNNQGKMVTVDGPYSLMHSVLFSDRFYTQPMFSLHYEPQLLEEVEEQNAVLDGEVICTRH